MSVAFIFPGQGSQHPGMLHELLDHPAVLGTLDEISDELHCDVRTLDMERCLEFTVPVQLALFAAGKLLPGISRWVSVGLAGASVGVDIAQSATSSALPGPPIYWLSAARPRTFIERLR